MDDSNPGEGTDVLGKVVDDRYRILRKIARGGMADVYLAKDSARKCHVAVKILRSRNADAQRRFAVEAELLSNIKSAGLVQASDFGKTEDDQSYMALEYLEGGSLSDRLAQGPLPWRDVAEYGAQVADALHALHLAGIVHRDVKPGNIMLTREGDRFIAKLVDLGLASVGKRFQDAQDEHFTPDLTARHPTQLGQPIGTPAFLPPEAGQCAAALQLDVFALGVTIYQLCTGLLPQSTDRRPVHVVCPASDAPEDLSRLLLAALEPDPLERLSSADHLRRGLVALLAAHPRMSSPRHLFAGSYDRLEVLGVGASAVVYRASDRALSRQVALKILKGGDEKPDNAAHTDDLIRFRRAARVLSVVRHPSIPRIFHTGIHDGQVFAITELCSGASATAVVRPDGHLRPDEVLEVGLQLAGALAAVHATGVVYRDLHPGNVLIARGASPRAWIFDFDQAQVSPEFYTALTGRWDTPPELRAEPKHEKPLRNMDYASPEVRAGAAFTTASDVYALGLLLYRLLTGKRPFPVNSTAEPISPRKLCPSCPRGLDRLLVQMLSADPERRPALTMVCTTLEDEQAELAAEDDVDPPTSPVVKDEPAGVPPTSELTAAPLVTETAAATSAPVRPDAPVPRRRPTPVVRASAVVITAIVCFMVGRATVGSPPPVDTSDPVQDRRGTADQAPPASAPNPPAPVVESKNRQDDPIAAPKAEASSETARPGEQTPTPTGSVPAARPVTKARNRVPAARPTSEREPASSDEAQQIATGAPVLAALRKCENVPGTIIAELEIVRGHGTVAKLNRHTPDAAVSWHACARDILEGLKYPASAISGRVRVRLQLG